MKPIEKLVLIGQKIDRINNEVLANKQWKLQYVNRGANDYCITIILRKKEVFNGSFNTYDSVLSALSLIESMFNRALDEKCKKEKEKNGK